MLTNRRERQPRLLVRKRSAPQALDRPAPVLLMPLTGPGRTSWTLVELACCGDLGSRRQRTCRPRVA